MKYITSNKYSLRRKSFFRIFAARSVSFFTPPPPSVIIVYSLPSFRATSWRETRLSHQTYRSGCWGWGFKFFGEKYSGENIQCLPCYKWYKNPFILFWKSHISFKYVSWKSTRWILFPSTKWCQKNQGKRSPRLLFLRWRWNDLFWMAPKRAFLEFSWTFCMRKN